MLMEINNLPNSIVNKFLKATEQINIKLPDIIGKRVMYSETNNSSDIHIVDYLWNIYCSEDGGKQFLERIINGGNIKTLSDYFKENLPPNENILQWQRKIKRVILAMGLEVCGISSTVLILGGKAISDENTDKLLYRIFYKYNLNFETNSVKFKHQGIKKIFIRDMIPKLYTVPSKYRFLDTPDTVSESGVYASASNVEEEVKKIYNDTVQEFKESYSDITDAEFSNYIPISSEDSANLVMVDDSQINTPEVQDSLIITLSNIMNSTNKDDANWEKKKEFILLFFKNLQERTINYK